MTHKFLLLAICAGLPVALSWGDECRCPSSAPAQQAGIAENTSRIAPAAPVQQPGVAGDESTLPKPTSVGVANPPAGVSENSDRTATD